MAGENGAPGSEGAGAGAGGTGSGDGAGSSGAPAGAAPRTIPVDALPEPLRNVAPEKVGETLNQMLTALVQTNRRNQEMKTQLEQLQKKNPPGTSTVSTSIPAEEGGAPALEIPKGKTLSDWLLEEPEKAMDYYLQKRFGGSLQKLNDIDSRLGRTEYNEVRQMFEDFDEYEDEVVQLLNASGAPKTRENIMGAYTMVVGQKAIEERSRGRRAAAAGEPATREPAAPVKEYAKTDLGEEIRLGMGMSEEEYYEKYAPGTALEIKVPT